jgi:hypothetical protein
MHDKGVTKLSKRDWIKFLRMLEDRSSEPNKALRQAVERYKRQVVKDRKE